MGQTVEVISEVPVSTEEVALTNKNKVYSRYTGPAEVSDRYIGAPTRRPRKPLVDTSATGTSCIHMWSNDWYAFVQKA